MAQMTTTGPSSVWALSPIRKEQSRPQRQLRSTRPKQLIAAHRAPEHHTTRTIHPVQREHTLCQIDPQRSNLFHDFPSRYQIERRKLNLGTSMPCGPTPASSRGSPFHSLERIWQIGQLPYAEVYTRWLW